MKFKKGGIETPLDPVTQALDLQNNIWGKAYFTYLAKKVELEHLEAKWADEIEGDESQASRERKVKASERWYKLAAEVVRLKASADVHKFRYEILDKEWLAQYAAHKQDDKVIKRQGA